MILLLTASFPAVWAEITQMKSGEQIMPKRPEAVNRKEMSRNLFAQPDLTCFITASRDEAGTEIIPNGGSTGFGSAGNSTWVHFTVEKAGGLGLNHPLIYYTTP